MKERPQSSKPELVLEPRFDDDGVQVSSGIGADGKEYPDPVPMSPPVGYEQPDDLLTIIRRMIHSEEFNRELHRLDIETEEEADDFDVDEDDDPRFPETIYEAYFEAKDKRKRQRVMADASEMELSRKFFAGSDGSSPPSRSPAQTPIVEGETSRREGSEPDTASKVVSPPSDKSGR